nr:MAG: putative movement protein [Tombusviridae sp.]
MEVEYESTKPWNELYKQAVLRNALTMNVGMEDQEIALLPSNFLTKLRLGMSGGYITIKRIIIKIVPLVSRNAGVLGRLYLKDITDTTGRCLVRTELLDLGQEIRLTLPHLDFVVSTKSAVPIVFGFEELHSTFLEGRELFSVSLSWQFGLSSRPYSLPAAKLKVAYPGNVLKSNTKKPTKQTLV